MFSHMISSGKKWIAYMRNIRIGRSALHGTYGCHMSKPVLSLSILYSLSFQNGRCLERFNRALGRRRCRPKHTEQMISALMRCVTPLT